MARPFLIVCGLLLVSAHASAQESKPLLPDEFFGLTIRLGVLGVAGDGADRVADPLWGAGGSLQMRLNQNLYLDFSGDTIAPVSSSAPKNGFLLGIDQQELGLRLRLPLTPVTHFLAGAGGGGSRLRDVKADKTFDTAPTAYGMLGWERRLTGSDSSAGYVGVEASGNHYFLPKNTKSPFDGESFEVRATFSYYFGGAEAADCW